MTNKIKKMFLLIFLGLIMTISITSCSFINNDNNNQNNNEEKPEDKKDDEETKKTSPSFEAPTARTNLVYNGEEHFLINTGASADGNFVYKIGNDSYSENVPKATNAGTYVVYYKLLGDSKHLDSEESSLNVTIAKATPLITPPSAKTLTYTGSAQALVNEGTTTGGTLQYKLGDAGTYSASIPTAIEAGTYKVYYKVVGNDNYNDVDEVFVNVTISETQTTTKQTPQVTKPQAKALTYNGSAQNLITAGSTTGGTLKYKLGEDGTYSTSIPTATNAGTYKVYYKVEGNNNYNDVAEASVTVTIAKATPSITPPTAKTLTYDGSAQSLITAGSTTGGTIQYKLCSDGTYSTSIPIATNVGTYKIYYKVVGNNNYNDVAAAFVTSVINATQTTTKQTPQVTAPTAIALTYNGSAQNLIAAGSTTGGTLKYKLGEDGTYSTSIPTATNAGTYVVCYKVEGNDDYNDVAEASVNVTISKATATITTMPTANTITADGEPHALLSAGVSSFGDIEYRLGTTGTYSPNIPSVTEAGEYTVYFKVEETKNYNGVSEQSVTVIVRNSSTQSSITLLSQNGGNETAVVSFEVPAGTTNTDYNVYYSDTNSFTNATKIDKELIFINNTTATAYLVGLAAGNYYVKVEKADESANVISNIINVSAQDRSGYAHFDSSTDDKMITNGVGAYNNDGTLKDKAVVVYVTDSNKNTVTAQIGTTTYSGLANILSNANSTYPLDIRIIGSINAAQWNKVTYINSKKTVDLYNEQTTKLGNPSSDKIYASSIETNSYSDDIAKGITELEGLNSYASRSLKDSGKSSEHYEWDSCWNMMSISQKSNITIEGIGTDAKIFQWGLNFTKCNSIEVKNITFDDYTEDAIGIEGGSKNDDINYANYWIHNCTFEQGSNNWDLSYELDKGDGDGSTDFKRAHNLTISYCVYNNTHKSNLIGANNACLQYNITLHHNYYNACELRLPLVRQANVHMYNNYYHATVSHGISARGHAYAFIENSYFDGKNPFMLGYATKDKVDPVGTTIKAINNIINATGLSNSSDNGIAFGENGIYVLTTADSTSGYSKNLSATRTTKAVDSVCKPDGTTDYTNFDTNSTLFYYDSTNQCSNVMNMQDTADVPAYVQLHAGAGNSYYLSLSIQEVEKHTVTYNFIDETNNTIYATQTEKVVDGNNAPTLTPVITGYSFKGYYTTSGSLYNISTAVTSDITINVVYQAKTSYTVTFVSYVNNNEETISSTTVYEGDIVSRPTTNPTMDGYTFDDWYTSSSFTDAFDFTEAISSTTKIYAKFNEYVEGQTLFVKTNATSPTSGEIFSAGNITVTLGGTVTLTEKTATSLDGKYSFTHALLPGGGNRTYTFNSTKNQTIVVYYTITNSSWADQNAQLKKDGIEVTSYSDSNRCPGTTPVSYELSLVANTNCVLTSSARLVIWGFEYTNSSSTTVNNLILNMYKLAQGNNTSAGNQTYDVKHVKTIYKVGDSFDSSNLTATADGTTIEYSNLNVFGFEATKGTHEISVSYGGKTETYDVYVLDASLNNLNVAVDASYTVGGTTTISSVTYITFKTIEQALEYLRQFVTPTSSNRANLYIKAGYYNEKIEIDIPYLTIIGEGTCKATYSLDENYSSSEYNSATIIEWNSLWGVTEQEFVNVTDSTQTIFVKESALYCEIKNLTISNANNCYQYFANVVNSQSEHRALALLVQSDHFIMEECSLLGYQDTIEFFSGRSYIKNSYISGATDFIFGTNATVYFNKCEIRSIYNGSTDGGYINAFKGLNKSINDSVEYGAIYDDCDFTADNAITSSNTSIARPWDAGSAIMVMNSRLGAHISKTAYSSGTSKNQRYVCWTNNGSTASEPTTPTVKFYEYNNSGTGAISSSINGCTVLTDATVAEKYSNFTVIFGKTNGNVSYYDIWDGTTTPEVDNNIYYYFDGTTKAEGTCYYWNSSVEGKTATLGDIYIDATSGKFAARTGDTQINTNTTLTFTVSFDATITLVSYNHSYNVSVGGTTNVADNNTYVFDADENDEVIITATGGDYFYKLVISPR